MVLTMQMAKNDKEIKAAAAAAEIVVKIHQQLSQWLCAGKTLAAIDAFVAEGLKKHGATSAFLKYKTGHYPAFPSYSCLSPNEVIVHGTAGMSIKPLKAGDIISIDIGVKYQGWIGDAAWTYIIEKPNNDEVVKLCECGITSLQRGVEQLKSGNILLDWARVVQSCVEIDYGFHCIRGLGGHGYGKILHTPPYVSNTVPIYNGEWQEATLKLRPGMLLAVEPMVAIGTAELIQHQRKWPILTADGSLSVHYEHDIIITDSQPLVLTKELENLPMIVGV